MRMIQVSNKDFLNIASIFFFSFNEDITDKLS